MVPQRLVEVHRLEDRGIEAGGELRGDDDDLQRVIWISEAVEQLLFGITVTSVFGVLGLATIYRHFTMSEASGGRCLSSSCL